MRIWDGKLFWMCATAFLFGLLVVQHFSLRNVNQTIRAQLTDPPHRVLYVIVPEGPVEHSVHIVPTATRHET